jgi:hypothetical protein
VSPSSFLSTEADLSVFYVKAPLRVGITASRHKR